MEHPSASPLDARSISSAFFRAVNDNIMRLNAERSAARHILCECGGHGCTSMLQLSVDAYSTVREDPSRFLLAPGHQLPRDHRLVSGDRALAVVQQLGPAPPEVVLELTVAGKPRPLVLIVDDDPLMRELCATCLADAGVVVLEAPDGQRGLEQAVALRPDLVITDISMPVLDGLRLAAALRRDNRTEKIPLIFLTGESAASFEARGLELGVFAHLAKPFDPEALLALATGMLGLFAEARAAVVTPIRRAAALFVDPPPRPSAA
jgi:two-component system, chemotaxis family, chemotaxis protein CheY